MTNCHQKVTWIINCHQISATVDNTSTMKTHFSQLTRSIRRLIWTIIVAYMLGVHNFYKGEDKNTDTIVITIEHNEAQEDSAPKD
jgi:hypothetical protein